MVARRAHNPKVVGSNPAPATNTIKEAKPINYWFGFLRFTLRVSIHVVLSTA